MRNTTTNATGGYCVDGTGFAGQVFAGRTVTLDVDPDPLQFPSGVFLDATYPNGGAPLDLVWFIANATGTNITNANIAYQ